MCKFIILALLGLFLAESDVLARGLGGAAGKAGYVYNNTTDNGLKMASLVIFALAFVAGVIRAIVGVICFISAPFRSTASNPYEEERTTREANRSEDEKDEPWNWDSIDAEARSGGRRGR